MSSVLEPAIGEATPVLPRARDARARRWRWIFPALASGIVVIFIAQILVDAGYVLSPARAWTALVGDGPRLDELAVAVRLPRAVMGLMVGAALGAAGALLQALTRNPLAAPEITGVASGAVAAVLSWVAFGPALPYGLANWILPAVAAAGGLVATAIVYLLTRTAGAIESTRFLLMGILTGGVLSSISTLALLFLGTGASEMLRWLSGSLALKSWLDVQISAVGLVPAFALLALAIPRANVLQLGDDVAVTLGQRRELDRLLVLVVCVVLTAGAVCTVGAIGFIGLFGPHIVRRWVGSDLRRLVPAAMLASAAMLMAADMLARAFSPRWALEPLGLEVEPRSLPVGVYLLLFGVPFFISLIRKRQFEGGV